MIDTTRGTARELEAWEQHLIAHEQPLRTDDYDAVQELDRLRLEALERDAIPEPRLSGEPTRRDPCEGFLHHRTIGG